MRIEPDAVAIGDPMRRIILEQRAQLMHAARVEPLELGEGDSSVWSASSAGRSSSRAWTSTGIRRPSGTSPKLAGRIFEEGPAGQRQRPDQPVAERIMEHGRAAARRMIADLLLGLEHRNARMVRQRRRGRKPGDAAADDQDVRGIHLAQAAVSRSFTTLPPCVRRIAFTISSSSGSTGRPDPCPRRRRGNCRDCARTKPRRRRRGCARDWQRR